MPATRPDPAASAAARAGDPHATQAYYEDPEVVAEYLDRRTGQPLNRLLHDRQVRFVNRVLRARDPASVLEIAPGPARLTAELRHAGRLLAIDRSAPMLAAAGARCAARRIPLTLVRGDAFALPVASASVDLVLATRFFRRFANAERGRLYAEVARVLRPGGALVLDAQNRVVALPHRQERGLDRYPVFDQLYALDELVDELEQAGLRVATVEGMVRHARLQRRLNRLRRLGPTWGWRWLLAAVEALPSRSPSTWMVVCERRR